MKPARVPRPSYNALVVSAALKSNWCGWHLSEKMDGVWAVRELADCSVVGEAMRDGRFFAFDIPRAFGEDIRPRPWIERSAALDELFARLNPKLNWHRCATGNGSEFIEAILARGGEGVVCKPWQAPFGVAWCRVKHTETFDAVVVELNHTRGSIRLALAGEDCGWVPCHAAFDRIRLGDVVEIEAYGRHASGKLREARFKRIRHDKMKVTA